MRETTRDRAGARMARLTALGAGVLLLAGCATGYSFVQPDVAGSGGYYTSDGPYSGQGYYDYYGAGPYYSGTSGYDYYNGTWPYGGAYGYYDPYGYGGYGSGWTFSLGISNVWNFPGYWGPWYTTVFPSGGCYSWRCGSRHYRHGHQHDHSWRHEDTSSGPPDVGGATDEHDLTARRERNMEISAWRQDHFVRAPRQGLTGSFAGVPARPARMAEPIRSQAPFAGAVAAPVAMPAPRNFTAPSGMTPQADVARSMPVRPAPAMPAPMPPPSPNHGAPSTKIQ